MKDNPTAYDLLLAYAECVESWSVDADGIYDNWPETSRVLMKHGWTQSARFTPLDWMNDLRRRALDAARKEAEDGK